MRHRRRLALALVSMATGAAASVAFGAPALAAPTDPPGNNGTVKIDGVPVDDDISNEPHVPCDFEVQFFGFDEGQTADITLAGQPPSSQDFVEIITLEDQLVSDDPAAGGENDVDEVFPFSASNLDLTGIELHPQQGYHLKLTVFSEGLPGGKKFKVFWLQPCEESPSPTPTTESPTPTTPPPTESVPPSESPTSPGGVSPTTPPSGPGLPVTGVAATSIALTGLGLIGGGAALLWMRRRRDITFTS
jgi:LPXTG-motif cell wall-anchored protein